MNKANLRKALILSACALIALAVGLFFSYEKHRVKPLFDALHLSSGEVVDAELRYFDGQLVELDPQQVNELCSVLDGCSLELWSSSNSSLSNYYASAMLYTSSPHPEVEIMLSEDGSIGINDFRHKYLPTYTLVDGGDALYRCFDDMMPPATHWVWD